MSKKKDFKHILFMLDKMFFNKNFEHGEIFFDTYEYFATPSFWHEIYGLDHITNIN